MKRRLIIRSMQLGGPAEPASGIISMEDSQTGRLRLVLVLRSGEGVKYFWYPPPKALRLTHDFITDYSSMIDAWLRGEIKISETHKTPKAWTAAIATAVQQDIDQWERKQKRKQKVVTGG